MINVDHGHYHDPCNKGWTQLVNGKTHRQRIRGNQGEGGEYDKKCDG